MLEKASISNCSNLPLLHAVGAASNEWLVLGTFYFSHVIVLSNALAQEANSIEPLFISKSKPIIHLRDGENDSVGGTTLKCWLEKWLEKRKVLCSSYVAKPDFCTQITSCSNSL